MVSKLCEVLCIKINISLSFGSSIIFNNAFDELIFKYSALFIKTIR